jgi:hypothetical protein
VVVGDQEAVSLRYLLLLSLLVGGLLDSAVGTNPPPQRKAGYVTAAVTPKHRQRTAVPGITYTIDTSPDLSPTQGAFRPFVGIVAFAARRGRLDIVAKSGGPEILAAGIRMSPLAATGDYYLFDSTGFILVRPSLKTFASFSLADASYNYENRRDGWPEWFELTPVSHDTVGAPSIGSGGLTQHGQVRVYWHTDACSGGLCPIARGRLTIGDAPPGEASAARWFGPTFAFASLAAKGVLLFDNAWLTAVTPFNPTRGAVFTINFITKQHVSRVDRVEVDPSRLRLPDGFTETTWPGFETLSNLPSLSVDRGAKWRGMP